MNEAWPQETPTTPAGWYPAPGEPGRERYWDGVGWTATRKTPERSRGIRWVLVPLAVLSLVALVAATAIPWGGDTADIPMIEREVAAGFEDQSGQRVEVDCPSLIEWDTGGTFKCAVMTPGGDPVATVEVSMQNDEGEWFWRTV